VHIGQQSIKESTYYVAAMAAFGVLQACYSNIAIGITAQRDAGVLKRTNGTPLPAGSFLASRVLHSSLVAVLLVVITVVFGRVAYTARIPSGVLLGEFLVMLIVGAAAFCALGLAVSALIPNADASSPVVLATLLPLAFLSGIFIAFGNSTPTWIVWVARVFPVRSFLTGMQAAFLGTPFHWSDVGVVAAWGLAGLVFAMRYFNWEPRTG
jgi:ABC-2 type transport system permease protein